MRSSQLTQTEMQIEHACPQCGAPITLAETDRLISCEFCRVKSYLVADDVFRYVLPPRTQDREPIYIPYWRFRGVLYACSHASMNHRIVDASLCAVDSRALPPSLGLRPQTLKLQFAVPGVTGRFVDPESTGPGAAEVFSRRFAADFPQPIHHREFIGESLSLIYAPFYVEDRLIDAVVERPVAGAALKGTEPWVAGAQQSRWPVRFIPTLCPHCGWDLEGARDSLVLTCANCNSAWRSAPGGIARAPFGCLPAFDGADVYLPFWRVEAQVTGLQLESYADLVRVANLPKVIQEGWQSRRFRFWVPAFKIRPQVFLRTARAVTLAQPLDEPRPNLPELPCHPVNLPRDEVIECLKVLLAALLRPAASYYPRLPQIRVAAQEMVLAFVPFAHRRTELVHERYHLAINKNTLSHGSLL